MPAPCMPAVVLLYFLRDSIVRLKVFSLFQNKYYIFFAKYKKKFFKKSFFLPQNNSKIQEIHQIINLVTYVTKAFHISDKS